MDAAPLGVMGAMDSETSALREALTDAVDRRVLGCQLTHGRLDGHPVVLATSGVGKVNAALTTAAMASAGVSGLVFVGVAGAIAPGVAVGDAVIATSLIQHDVDITAFGRLPGFIGDQPAGGTPDDALSDRLRRACAAIGVTPHAGVIASGDQFISSSAQASSIADRFGALAVEMEGAAVAQVCTRLGLPFAVLRWISDTADEHSIDGSPDEFMAGVCDLDLAVVRAFLATS